MENKVQLICYVDRLSGGGFISLKNLLNNLLPDTFGGVHVLPFYYPIDGTDAGFDPIDHTRVDPRLGTWEDVAALGREIGLVTDMIVNHMSSSSPEFLEYLAKGDKSDYAGLFLTKDSIFSDETSEEAIAKIYRPRPGLPFTPYTFANGKKGLFWTTFTSGQIDIDVYSPAGQSYLEAILDKFAHAGVKLIRLDAVGYAIKKAGTSCFMIPETFAFIKELTAKAHALGMEILVEIHSYYKDQVSIAREVDYVYDFALPPLILHAIYRKTGKYLKTWINISPRNCITVLDTHDGIGVIDVGAHSQDKSKEGLLPPEEIDYLVEEMHMRTDGTSRLATGAAASNLDLYQVNSTYYDALGQDDDLYLLARAIQFFSPGIPQVYYTGLLAEPNDMELLASTQVGRDINRHYFVGDEVAEAIQKDVVKRLIRLIKLRNTHPAFNGSLQTANNDERLIFTWSKDEDFIRLVIHFADLRFDISDRSGNIFI